MDRGNEDVVHHHGRQEITERQRNVVIGGVLLTMLLAALDQTIVAPAMPIMASALGDAAFLPWIITAYLLTSTATAPLYGKLSDIYGRRPVIFVGVAVFVLGSVVSALAPNMFVLILGRAIQGLGGGGLFALSQIVIGDLVPPLERARYAAWTSSAWAVAAIAGPLLGGYFAEHLHWSLIFWINLPLGLVAMAIVNGPMKKLPRHTVRHSVDYWGATLLIAATSFLLLVLTWGGREYLWSSMEVLGLAVVSAALWVGFVLRVLRASDPLISLGILQNTVVMTGAFAMFLLQAANISLSTYLPIYLQSWVGLSASQSGGAMLGLLLGTVTGATISGRLIPKVAHYKRIAMAGTVLSGLSLCGLSFLSDHPNLLTVEVLTALVGIGTGAGFPVGIISVQNAADPPQLGVATGLLTFLRSLGGGLGVAFVGALAVACGVPLGGEGYHTSKSVSQEASFGPIFMASAVFMLFALAVFWAMPHKKLRGKNDVASPME